MALGRSVFDLQNVLPARAGRDRLPQKSRVHVKMYYDIRLICEIYYSFGRVAIRSHSVLT